MEYRHATPELVLDKAMEYLSPDKVELLKKTIQEIQKSRDAEEALQQGLDTVLPLLERQLGMPSLLAGLSKEAIENPEIADRVGAEAAEIAAGTKKLDSIEEKNASKLDAVLLSKLLLASAKDIRSMLVKIAGELREMRFLSERPKEKQRQEPKTALEVFVPICHKLGLQKARWELEDLAMKSLYPKEYEQLKRTIPEKRAHREKEAEAFAGEIQRALQKEGLQTSVLGRAKNFYRIHQKMLEKKRTLEEIHDLTAARVICNSEEECYRALTIIQNQFKLAAAPIEDYIAHPKPNGYQSIHVDVQWKEKNCEIQIRTWKMHTEAEDGLAAHWEYKKYHKDKSFDSQLSITKQMADWLETQPNKRIMETLHLRFEKNKIFVFTPKNEVIELPEKATPIDFAYMLHSGLGNKCEKARVNGKLVPLHYPLETGDTVEILTSEKQQPKRNWLSFVKTEKAQARIRQALQIEQPAWKKSAKKKPVLARKRGPKPVLAKCCNPLPGDEIIAFKTTKRKIVIHQAACENAKKLPASRVVEVSQEQFPKQPYNVEITVRASNKAGLLAKILNEFSRFGCTINSTNTSTKSNQFSMRFNAQINNSNHLEKLLERIQKIAGVQDCRRG